MNAFIEAIGHLPPALIYAVVAAAVLVEMIILVGAFVPTLTLLLTVGALARTGQIDLLLVIAVAGVGAAVGDLLAHRTGLLLSHRLRTGRLGRRIPAAAWNRAEALMTHHGGRAVFLARFLPVLRTLTPYFAGTTHLPYHRIAPYSLTAAFLWASAEYRRRVCRRDLPPAHPHHEWPGDSPRRLGGRTLVAPLFPAHAAQRLPRTGRLQPSRLRSATCTDRYAVIELRDTDRLRTR